MRDDNTLFQYTKATRALELFDWIMSKRKPAPSLPHWNDEDRPPGCVGLESVAISLHWPDYPRGDRGQHEGNY